MYDEESDNANQVLSVWDVVALFAHLL